MEKQDVVKFNGDEYDIQTGLSAEDVKESMKVILPSAANADVDKQVDSDGNVTWILSERGGDKG